MCRWLAYSGSPVLLEELLVKPVHSLIDQSKHSRLGATTLNGDGFGVGWYGAPETPGRVPRHGAGLERPQPPRHRGPHLLAADLRPHSRLDRHARCRRPTAIRFATRTGSGCTTGRFATSRASSGSSRSRSTPRSTRSIEGSTDSELFFFLALTLRARGQPAARRRAGRRPDRGDRPPPRRRAPDPDDGGDDERRQHLGLPVLERARLAVTVLQHRGADPPSSVPRQPRPPRPLRRDAHRALGAARRPGRGVERGAGVEPGASSSEGRTRLHPFTPRSAL